MRFCCGHFGSLNLAIPVVHPAYTKNLLHVLKLLCPHCAKVLFPIPLAPETHPGYVSWNDYANKMNRKFDYVCQNYKGIERLNELSKVFTKKIISCGIPSEIILPEMLIDEEKKTNSSIEPSLLHFSNDEILETKKNLQGKKKTIKAKNICLLVTPIHYRTDQKKILNLSKEKFNLEILV